LHTLIDTFPAFLTFWAQAQAQPLEVQIMTRQAPSQRRCLSMLYHQVFSFLFYRVQFIYPLLFWEY
jgi:hypothetical protein